MDLRFCGAVTAAFEAKLESPPEAHPFDLVHLPARGPRFMGRRPRLPRKGG